MKKHLALLLLILFPFILQAYSPSAEQTDRDLKLLGTYFLQVTILPIFGLGAFIFSLLGMLLINRKLKIMGLIFLSMFTLLTLLGFWAIVKEEIVNTFWNRIIWVELLVIIVCIVLLTIKRVAKQKTNSNLLSDVHNPKPENQEDEFPYF